MEDYSLPVTYGELAPIFTPPTPSWMRSMLDSPVSNDPYITLRRKLAADKKAALDRKRAADDAVLPMVIQDSKDSAAREQALMQRIELAMGSLNAPPPQMGQASFNQGEEIAAGISALFAPESMPQVLQALQGASQQRTDVEFDNALRAYGLDRETAKMGLQMLMGRLDDEQRYGRDLKRDEYSLRAGNAKSTEEINRFYDDQELDFEKFIIQQERLADTADAQDEVRRLRLAFDEWKAQNITKPDTDSKISKREADVQNAKAQLARLNSADKQKFALASQKLRAEFGRLSEQQKRTIIAEKALGVTGYNSETARFNAELRAWEGQMRALGLFEHEDSIWNEMFGDKVPMPPQPTPPSSFKPPPTGGGKRGSPPPPLPGNLGGSVKPMKVSVQPEKKKSKGGILDRTFERIGDEIRAKDLREKYKY